MSESFGEIGTIGVEHNYHDTSGPCSEDEFIDGDHNSSELLQPEAFVNASTQSAGAVREIIIKNNGFVQPDNESSEGSEDVQASGRQSDTSSDKLEVEVQKSKEYNEIEKSWKQERLHLFVLSEAGKPIYSRHGDETVLSSIMGIMQALVSFVASSGDELRSVNTTDRKFVFLSRSHLILVAVGEMSEPFSHICSYLNYVYYQILSSLTLQRLEKLFTRHQNLDLRRLLIGDSRLLSSLIDFVGDSFGVFLNAISCTPLAGTSRDFITQALVQNAKSKDLVFAILLDRYRIASIVRMKNRILNPIDIHILSNLVRNSQSLKSAQSSWLPICLPKFDANGFLYAYIAYLDDSTCLILLTVDNTQFYTLQSMKENIVEHLETNDYLETIRSAKGPTTSDTGIKDLRHFICKYIPIAQYVTTQWEAPYITNAEDTLPNVEHSCVASQFVSEMATTNAQKHVLVNYRRLNALLNHKDHPTKFVYRTTQTEVFSAWKTDSYEIYATLEPFVTKSDLMEIRKQLFKWIETKKSSLFILSSPTF